MQAHHEWSRRVLRCAVLRTSPGDDVLREDAHALCEFGHWFAANRSQFDELDAERAVDLERNHVQMHAAIRNICRAILDGRPGNAEDLDTFELTQRPLIENLAHFKTLAVSKRSHIDILTGLPLRHDMEHDFDLMMKRNQRRGTALLIMMVDVDHFKRCNDEHGHAAGDIVLQRLAVALKFSLRDEDFVFRFGGEEFVLLLEVKKVANAAGNAAQRVLDIVRALSIELPNGATVRPTVTIGVAQATEKESLDSVVQRADSAMYAGKKSGRNRCVIA